MSDTNQGNTPTQDDDLPQPEVRKSKLGFSLIWLVPIIAALVGISLLVTHFTSAGPKITVTFLTAEGIEANKTQVKSAVEKLFKVKVAEVRTSNVEGKLRRRGRFTGYRPDWKKAYVKLKDGQKVPDFAEI